MKDVISMQQSVDEKYRKIIQIFDELERVFKATQLVMGEFKTSVLNEYRYCARALIDFGKATTDEDKYAALARAEVAISAAFNDAVDYLVNSTQEAVNELFSTFPTIDVKGILQSRDFREVANGLKHVKLEIAASRCERENRLQKYIDLSRSREFSLIIEFSMDLFGIEFQCQSQADGTLDDRILRLVEDIKESSGHHSYEAFPRFELVYQPKFNVDDVTGIQISGAEALIRLMLSSNQTIAPNSFLNLAHKFHLTDKIGTWVLDQVILDASDWSSKIERKFGRKNFDLAINVAPSEMEVDEFSSIMHQKLAGAGVQDLVSIELIENWRETENSGLVTHSVKKLSRETKIYIDDFGNGDTKLMYISEIPDIYALKIDKCVVDGLETRNNESTKTFIKGIVAFARAHGIEVVAEGVETDLQFEELRKLDVSKFQGFNSRLSRPLNRSEFEQKYISTST